MEKDVNIKNAGCLTTILFFIALMMFFRMVLYEKEIKILEEQNQYFRELVTTIKNKQYD